MKTNRLYLRMYKYVALSTLLAILLTTFTLELFRFREGKDMREHFVRERVSLVLYLLEHIYTASEGNAQTVQGQAVTLGDDLNWQIRYLVEPHKAEESSVLWAQLQDSPQEIVLDLAASPPQALAYLFPGNERAGVVYLSFPPESLRRQGPPHMHLPRPASQHGQTEQQRPKHRPGGPPRWWGPPLIISASVLVLLSILLLPLVRSLIRPMRELFRAIEKVSEGDFSSPIVLKRETEFTPVANAFNEMVERIQAMLQEKQRLIADVSHELRSPLGRLRMSLELLSKEGKGKVKYIERGIREVEELDHLIGDLLDISALELDAHRAPLEAVELQDWVQSALDSHQLVFDEHGFEIELQTSPQGAIIQGRRHLLDRVLYNLFSNALKYAPRDSVLSVRIFVEGDSAGVELRDRGPGLPEAELDKILQPFYRPDLSRTRKTGGTGLGLAIVDKIMRLHKGRVEFRLPTDTEGGLIARLSWPLEATGPSTGAAGGPGMKTAPLQD